MNVTIRQWFGDNPPDFIRFPAVGEGDYGLDDWIGVPTHVFMWESPIMQNWLDLPFDDGFGSQGVPSFFAWTKDRVYYVWEYDGATSLAWVPRNP